jgi:AbiV family abortive infection protein
MEQAWHLLRDAVLLIQKKRYASSLVLATYCLEELGRAETYRQNAKRAFVGELVTLRSIDRAVREHQPKLYRAQVPVSVSEGFFGEPPPVGSEGERQLAERLAARRKALEQEAPRKALDDRQRALYVDRVQHVRGWNRPCQVISRDDADYYVGAADVRYGQLRLELKRDGSEVGKKIWSWLRDLQLPDPPWDVLTWGKNR